MGSVESEEFLKLFGCVIDIGTDVVGASFESNILQKYNGSFQDYLEDIDNKHRFYHQFDDKKINCCKCPPAGCLIPKKRKLEHWIFESVYVIDHTNSKPGHFLKGRNGFVQQICLSKYIARNVSTDSLDLTILVYFLIESGVLQHRESDAVKEIHDIRNELCHPKKTTH